MKVRSLARIATLKRFVSVVGLAVFAAACSDAAQITQPGAAAAPLFSTSAVVGVWGAFA